ncbi:MAG: M48 family metalloprotease [Deltaproteobacteria bacterium]|nr:M48 family metalloprotease [Deltaproteobacteria bacterium]
MFNNIIYFLVVLLIFEVSYPGKSVDSPLIYDLAMALFLWACLAAYSRAGFNRLIRVYRNGNTEGLAARYHALVLRLSILAIFIFAIDVYLLHLKYRLSIIPGADSFSTLQGIPAIGIFLIYLCTIWYFAYPAYVSAFKTGVKRSSFITSNVKLNIPIIFPWLILALIYDLMTIYRWSGPAGILNNPEGQMLFFAVFMFILIIVMPPFVQYWWECRPFEPSDRVDELKRFLNEMPFRYAGLLRWPLFEGRMMTAAIMGIVPRFRYILVTDSLMELLNLDELKAVLAHEAGHAKYRHILLYLIIILGYMFISFGLFDVFYYTIASLPWFLKAFAENRPNVENAFYMALSIPILISMFLYFRFLMGFFMRNFERQADLYSAVVMGAPAHTINSLEKIALFSGKTRDLPSWHHFSIRERVECLLGTIKRPDLIKGHNRFVAISFAIYLICTIGAGYLLNFSNLKQDLYYRMAGRALQEQIAREPGNIDLLQGLALLYHETERHHEAKDAYERILKLDPNHATALNNLSWLLVTSPDVDMRDPQRALSLAEKAVELERTPVFLDTLAEAYWANGLTEKAIETIKEAISLEKDDSSYYSEQLEKFKPSREVG